MASNGNHNSVGETENSLEKIKRQLATGSGGNLLQGPLLKRSETVELLRKWNERWIILDPTTGKMEYKIRRNEPSVKGTILFDANSMITVSPVNFHGLPKYESCCFYIGTPQKKEYFLCAETPGAARAWVATLHAAQLVLKAHKKAVNSLSGNSSAQLGTVATVVAAANSTALEASKEIEAAMRSSMRTALSLMTNRPNDGQLDDLTIMKETLRVKDEELQHLARDIRARDSTIKEIAEKLLETSEAAESAAAAAYAMDAERRTACVEIERLTKETDQQKEAFILQLRASEEKVLALSKERDSLLKQRDGAFQEALLWRSELAKARERAVILEAAVLRAEERVRVTEAEAEAKLKIAAEKEMAAINGREELLAYVNSLQAQVQRQQTNAKTMFEEKVESSSVADDTLPLTKHVDLSDNNTDDVDKVCLSVSRSITLSDDSEWNTFQGTNARVADVREVPSVAEGNSLDIPVDHDHSNNSQP